MVIQNPEERQKAICPNLFSGYIPPYIMGENRKTIKNSSTEVA